MGDFADSKMHKPCGLDVRYRLCNKPPEILRRLAPALEDDTGGGGRPQVAHAVFGRGITMDECSIMPTCCAGRRGRRPLQFVN